MHPLRGPTPDQNGCNAYGSGAMPTDRVHRTTLEYPKEESAAPHTSPVDRNTRSHKNPKHRRCEGRRRDLPRCRWAAAGPSRASRRPTEPPISTPGTTGVEGAGGTCRSAGGRRRGLAGLRGDAPSEARSADGSRAGRRPPAHTAAGPSGAQNTRGATSTTTISTPQRNEAATGCPATASSRSRSAVHNSATSNQAVMSTWSSTAARPASRRATGTRNGEQDT